MLKIKDEEFVDIKDYDGRYKIGNKGTVIGVSRSKDNRYNNKQWILKQYEDKNGYMYVTLQKDKKRKTIKVHRLVAEHFIENPNNYPCVNHIDSNRKNNDVSNLEWVTHKQNIEHAVKNHRFDNMAKLRFFAGNIKNENVHKIGIIALGSHLENHGPALPIDTDAKIASYIAFNASLNGVGFSRCLSKESVMLIFFISACG